MLVTQRSYVNFTKLLLDSNLEAKVSPKTLHSSGNKSQPDGEIVSGTNDYSYTHGSHKYYVGRYMRGDEVICHTMLVLKSFHPSFCTYATILLDHQTSGLYYLYPIINFLKHK